MSSPANRNRPKISGGKKSEAAEEVSGAEATVEGSPRPEKAVVVVLRLRTTDEGGDHERSGESFGSWAADSAQFLLIRRRLFFWEIYPE